MLTVEELIYVSLAVGVLIGVADSYSHSRRVDRAVDLLSSTSIVILVGLMGVVVGSEMSDLTGLEGLKAAAATLLVSLLPGLAGIGVGMALVRRREA